MEQTHLKPHALTQARLVHPGEFRQEKHYYDRVLNAQIHPLVASFLNLTNEQLIQRYCRLFPEAKAAALDRILSYQPKYLHWAGADLFHVTNQEGSRRMLLIELNSCPSGQKSMPLLSETEPQGGYRTLLKGAFLPRLADPNLPQGALAILYDKNPMENSGYAATLADLTGEPVYLACFPDGETDPCVRFDDGVMAVRDDAGLWQPIRAALRYVTQRPWNRIPVTTKTWLFNPVLACLAGGRNKVVADKAYEDFNLAHAEEGLRIQKPETVRNATIEKIPWWVRRQGGHAVIKNPYSNAGQGVWTITDRGELQRFLALAHPYDRFLLQSLIGNAKWSSHVAGDRLYHVGTVPNAQREIYAFDLRFMLAGFSQGFRPVSLYGRRARKPLPDELSPGESSWELLGTNLTIKNPDGSWDTESERLMLMDRKDFNLLGLGLDELTEAFMQTAFAVVAVDRMAESLITKNGQFHVKHFRAIDDDESLIGEIRL